MHVFGLGVDVNHEPSAVAAGSVIQRIHKSSAQPAKRRMHARTRTRGQRRTSNCLPTTRTHRDTRTTKNIKWPTSNNNNNRNDKNRNRQSHTCTHCDMCICRCMNETNQQAARKDSREPHNKWMASERESQRGLSHQTHFDENTKRKQPHALFARAISSCTVH